MFTNEQLCRLIEFIRMDDFDFYSKYISHLSLKEQADFFKQFPDFLMEDNPDPKFETIKEEIYEYILKRQS